MARTKTTTSIPNSNSSQGNPIIYAEGKHEYSYLTNLADNEIILKYKKGTLLPATEIKERIKSIKRDIENDAIEHVIWIVDGGDDHIKASTFVNFYNEWLVKKDHDWKKLHILINTPCLEYWFLLHRIDPPLHDDGTTPLYFEDANSLLESSHFRSNCEEGKGANLVRAIARNTIERKRAINRAKKLEGQLEGLKKKNLLKVARAEMYKIFELIPIKHSHYSSSQKNT